MRSGQHGAEGVVDLKRSHLRLSIRMSVCFCELKISLLLISSGTHFEWTMSTKKIAIQLKGYLEFGPARSLLSFLVFLSFHVFVSVSSSDSVSVSSSDSVSVSVSAIAVTIYVLFPRLFLFLVLSLFLQLPCVQFRCFRLSVPADVGLFRFIFWTSTLEMSSTLARSATPNLPLLLSPGLLRPQAPAPGLAMH